MVLEQTVPIAAGRTRVACVDADIHHTPAPGALDRYLSERWREHLRAVGVRCAPGFLYPKGAPNAARTDAWPPSGNPPGSELPFLREQLLDHYGIEIGILNCLHDAACEQNPGFAAALAQAVNDWTLAEWLEPEPRLRATLVVPNEYPDLAAAEVERAGSQPGFVGVLLMVRSSMPFGKRQYWPIYEAAARHDLPICIHFGGRGGNPISAAGWPSYYVEDHTGMAQALQAQLVSFVFEGVFARFPTLRLALLEGGFAWLPPLLWRMDRAWERYGAEVPWIDRPPSQIVRERVRLSTQPMEEPERPAHLAQLLGEEGLGDLLMFATDYPHWDFDDPGLAFPTPLPPELSARIMRETARSFFHL